MILRQRSRGREENKKHKQQRTPLFPSFLRHEVVSHASTSQRVRPSARRKPQALATPRTLAEPQLVAWPSATTPIPVPLCKSPSIPCRCAGGGQAR